MEFIDNTGHIFSLPSYSEYPTGYEYDETPYIFWVNETGKLSVDNYYVKAIRVVFDSTVYNFDDDTHLSIKMDSKTFGLVGSVQIDSMLRKNKNLFDYIKVDNSILKQSLTEDDILLLTNLTDENGYEYSMCTFYVVTYSESEEVMLTNILIDIYNSNSHKYCPVTVGAEFVDENEMLIINGKNMGIDLPKDIIRAVYKSSFYNYASDEYLYNSKLKELLLNYMNIKGECGNYKSAIDSLKWFEWGDKLKIVKLLETDNQFINQYIIDFFDINNDVIESFKLFRNSTYVKLYVNGSKETDDIYVQNFDTDFWGEGKPKVENIINTNSYNTYNEGDIKFYKPYYDFLFEELSLKLAALDYYYKQYFLPIHLFIHNSTVQFQCFVNDNKLMIGENKTIITEIPQVTYDVVDNVKVEFPKTDYVMLNTQAHFIDENYNEFNKYLLNSDILTGQNSDSILYWVNDNCMSIPIKFSQYDNNKVEKEEQYYDCHLILEKIDKVAFNYLYSFPFSFDYDELFSLNLSDEFGNCVGSSVISFQLYDVLYDEQKLIISDNWSEFMSLSEIKKFIDKNYIKQLPFNTTKPVFNIKIKSVNYLKTIKMGNFNYSNYSNCEIIDDTHKQIFERNFKFVQKLSHPETYYKNFVIIPKVFGKKYDINFWLNNEFNIYLSVNGKWFTYNFKCNVPEFNLEIGKLYYKYFLDTTDSYTNQHGDATLFSQVRYLSDNKVEFNRFMWQPNLVKVNNINFFDNLLNYYKNYKYNITYNNNNSIDVVSDVEGNTDLSDIKLNDMYYVLTFNNQKFYIHTDVIVNYFIKNGAQFFKLFNYQLSEENKKLDWIAYYNKDLQFEFTALYNETNYSTDDEYKGSSGSLNTNEFENVLVTNEDGKNITFKTVTNSILDVNIIDTNDSDNYVIVLEDETTDKTDKCILVFFELDKNGIIHFYINDVTNKKVYLNIEKTIYKNIEVIYNRYKEFPNIVNNKKYLNKIHLYDIYKNGQLLKFEELTNEQQAKLYNIFFKSTTIDEHCGSYVSLKDREDVYDFYLMHDATQWYSLFISKQPENRYPNGMLDIYDDDKQLVYLNESKRIYPTYTENNEIDYTEINNTIIDNVCKQNNLTRNDLYYVFNSIDDGIKYGENNNWFDYLLKITLINKIFNINIPSSQNNDGEYIEWNVSASDSIFSPHQNWAKIHPNDIYCPYCGSNKHISINDDVATNGYSIICNNPDCVNNGKEIGYGNYFNNTILTWNTSQIPYKLIYSLEDDTYSEKNKNGLFHNSSIYKPAQYTFSMNNMMYYINAEIIDGNIKYFMNNTPVEIKTTVYDNRPIGNIIEDKERDTWFIENAYNETDKEYHNYDIISGIYKEENITHYVELNNIFIYNKKSNKPVNYLSDYYLLYDGYKLYTDEWYMVISVNSTDTIENKITDIIKIYKKSDDSELQWILNTDYNYNNDTYNYYYYNTDEKTYIEFDGNEPQTPIYMDNYGYLFILEFYKDSTDKFANIGKYRKQYVYKEFKTDAINNVPEDKFTLYNVNTGIYYSLFYNTDNEKIILNTKQWCEDNNYMGDAVSNAGKPIYDGLYYLYTKTQVDATNFVHKWQVLVYIDNKPIDSIDWYYKINNKEYKYTGPVVYYLKDDNGNNILDENNKPIQLNINTSDNIIITLSDVNMDPITVELNVINETQASPMYYQYVDEYMFKYVKSDDKFLVNRMQYVSCNGKNHFNADDIIVSTISPKMDKTKSDSSVLEYKSEFILGNTTKWVYKPLSLKMKQSANVTSTTEMAIMSIGDSNIKYEKGYYDLICNYSIDSNTTNIITKTARILIK